MKENSNAFLTVEDAIRQGVIDPAAIQKTFAPRNGVSVVDHERQEHLFFPDGWPQFRLWKREDYLADKLELTRRQRKTLRVQFKPIPTAGRVREPLLDLGAGVDDKDLRVARQFLIEQGLVDGPMDGD